MALSLVNLLARTVETHPTRPALAMVGGPPLSYAELDRQSAGVAAALCRTGIRRGDRVGLAVPKSVEGVVGLWGILRAGAAYVPIDPGAPAARAAFVAANADLAALVGSSDLPATVAAIVEAVPDIPVLQVHGEETLPPPRLVPHQVSTPIDGKPPVRQVNVRDLAYVLYTSGSTGTPKGVMLSHGAALSFVEWAVGRFAIGPDDVLANHAPLHFDISTLDVFGAAATGAELVILDEESMRLPGASVEAIARERVTVWYSVPGALRRMVRTGGFGSRDVPSLRTVLFAGERYPVDELKALQTALTGVALFNLYGPTETNVCTYWQVPPAGTWSHDAIPIGVDCETAEGAIVDEQLHPVPDGAPGELLVRGGTLMNGYWADPERTARALVPNFLHPHLGDFLYRTGDLVRREPDGTYAFLGRRDHQVKVRGYRVELGEVESVLLRTDGVEDAAVVAVERLADADGETELVAFVVGKAAESPSVLRRRIAGFLPKYMLPSEIRQLARMPITSTGKVDRQALTALVRAPRRAPATAPPPVHTPG